MHIKGKIYQWNEIVGLQTTKQTQGDINRNRTILRIQYLSVIVIDIPTKVI